jgi:hypothetical protein
MEANTNQPKGGGPTTTRRTLKQQEFLKSEAASMARVELKLMVGDPKYNTRNSFSAKSPDEVPFVEKHIQYLCDHPNLNPRHYLSNLKLKTKLRS